MDVNSFLTKNSKTIQILLIIAVVSFLVFFVVNPMKIKEGLADFVAQTSPSNEEEPVGDVKDQIEVEYSEEELAGAEFKALENAKEITPEDLLPKSSDASEFDQAHPVAQNSLDSKNFLTAGFNVGINTVSNSNRNSNLTLRADPPIPVTPTGPWNQSTILPDTQRKTLDIC